MKKPQILTLNLSKKANQKLIGEGFNVYKGNLGKLVDTKNKKDEFKYCLLNYDFPQNIHEYDIIIVDLSNKEMIDYVKKDNTRIKNLSKNNIYLLCEYPQTIFDPRAMSAGILAKEISEIAKKDSIIIVFQTKKVETLYHLVEGSGFIPRPKGTQQHSIFQFLPIYPFSNNKYGKETEVVIGHLEFKNFLNKYNDKFTYENIFYHPTMWKGEEQVPNPKFHPIIKNANDEIVSFVFVDEKSGNYIFPVLEDNSEFILEFLQNIAPTIHPKIFPYSSLSKWTDNKEYALPNHIRLLDEKKALLEEFEKNEKIKDKEILENQIKYNFLHKILTETSDELVSSVIKFLKWLGFESVIDMDSEAESLKEEDIQIESKKGLLVIEVKGIGGTSKDSECSQILKVKYRRAKERGKFDVFGLYIVNHQRHLPPLQRKNPPFTKEQMQDALNEERGLLTTWQLFQLYFDIQNKIITKGEAREIIYSYGLVVFTPNNIKLIGTIEEVFLKGEVFIIKLTDTEIKLGDTLFIERNNKYQKLTIQEIRLDGKKVKNIRNGEVGIKGSVKVTKKSKVWIKNLS